MFKKNRCYDNSMNFSEASFKFESDMGMSDYPQAMPNMMGDSGCMPPLYECPEERVCHREIIHEVKHVCPINTRIIKNDQYDTHSICLLLRKSNA